MTNFRPWFLNITKDKIESNFLYIK